jgi:hypothetical protein
MTHPEIQGLIGISSSFSTDQASQYDLVIKLEEGKATYLVGDAVHQKPHLVAEIIAAPDMSSDPVALLGEYADANPWMKGPFKSVRILVANQKVTLVPFAMYNNQDKAHYLSFNVDLDSEDVVISTPVPSISAECIFAIPGKQQYRITKLYPDATFHHLAALALHSMTEASAALKQTVQVYLHFSGSAFFIHVLRNQELVFFNSFSFSNPEEFIYYILNIAEKLNIKIANSHFVLSGNVNPQDALYAELLASGALIELADTKDFKHKFASGKPVMWHHHADLIKLFTCAS